MPSKKPSKSTSAKPRFKRQRGRPTAEQAAAITSRILGSARDLFFTIGIDASSMDAIARKAEIPRSTLYKRYPDKNALIVAVVEDRIRHWASINLVKPIDKEHATLEQKIKDSLLSMLIWYGNEEVRALTRLAMGQKESAALVQSTMRSVGYMSIVDTLYDSIEQCAVEEGKNFKDPGSVATVILSMLAGWIATQPFDEPIPREDGEAFINRSIELIFHGCSEW